jgi:general secretion pathway protein L
MKFADQITDFFLRWIDCVSGALFALRRRFAPSRIVQLAEGPDGVFTILPEEGAPAQAEPERVRILDGRVVDGHLDALASRTRANNVEVVLQSSRFLFRPIELPRRASEFLEGIVRAQIDRLTPWPAQEAAFGWSSPKEIANDRVAVTVAATARSSIAPFAQALSGLGADSIAMSTVAPEEAADRAAIKVFEQIGRAALEIERLRRALVFIIVVSGLTAGAAFAADEIIGGSLQARQDDVAHKIAVSEATMRSRLDASRNSVVAGLERRKQQTPSSVIMLEALSRIFPDDTYVTELRMAGNKMQVVGLTRDAPSLIRLLAQSSYFSQATFFAPTTRSPSQPGENFHIEAQILPIFTPPT